MATRTMDQAQPARRTPPSKRPLIMVVDDDADVLKMCDVVLEQAGFDRALANSGEEAISLLEKVRPAVIVLDLRMPGMDGWSVAALIRKHERTARIPILALTGIMENVEDAARRAGATAFILKPLDPRRFVAAVKRLCPA